MDKSKENVLERNEEVGWNGGRLEEGQSER
jgi:hypothetical protein